MILLVDLAKSFGGAEIRVLNTMRGILGKRQCGAVVLAGSPLHEKMLQEEMTVFPLPYWRGSIKNALAIRRVIKENGVSLVDTQNAQSHLWGVIGALLSGSAKILVTAHSSKDITVSGTKSLLYEYVLKWCARRGASFVAVSQSVQEYLQGLGVSQKKISLITNGLPIDRLEQTPRSMEFRKSIGWTTAHFVIIVVGRLETIKGHCYLIEALPDIIARYPQVRCCVVGSGRCESDLKDRVEKLNLKSHVYFTGFRNDVEMLLKQSDVLCMPSLSEGLPYTLLESCALRVPILATRVGGIPEFLKDGESAILVEPGKPDEIAKGIKRLIETPDLASLISSRAFEVVRKKHDLSTTIHKTMAMYATLS